MASRSHVRSISLPSRSHPTTLKILEEINKLKNWESSSSTSTLVAICNALSGMGGLHKCLDELLSLQSTQQALSHHQHEKWVDELLEGSGRLLDICGNAVDVILQFKENVGDLQSALRRRKGDVCIESSINNYISSRKKMKRDAKKLLAATKKIDNKDGASPISDQDHQLSTMVRVLREVNAMSISIFQSLVFFFSTPVLKSNPSRWSLASKFMQKGAVSCQENQENMEELKNIDFSLRAISCKRADSEKMQIAQTGLAALEVRLEGLDHGLEGMFRKLINTRASLLNIISH